MDIPQMMTPQTMTPRVWILQMMTPTNGRELTMLISAYNDAKNWLTNNGFKQLI